MNVQLPEPVSLARLAVLIAVFSATATGQDGLAGRYLQTFCSRFSLNNSAVPPEIRVRLQTPMAKEVRDKAGRKWQATSRGLVEIPRSGRKTLLTGRDDLPVLKLEGIAAGPDGRLWIATPEGAIAYEQDAPARERWSYFEGERYLASDEVEGILPEASRAWVRTPAGVSLIEFRPFDLEHKSESFLRRLRARHLRYGYVNDCALGRPGDTSTCKLLPSDNDGLWTALYVAAECFRYGVTRSPEALENARESLAALARLVGITGISGFPARAMSRRGDVRDPEGEWHATPNREWEWKGDTSSDELAGHFFAYAVAYDLLPEESDRAVARSAAASIATHLLEHSLKLLDYGGRVTRWGDYSTEYFRTPEGRDEAPLSSLEILSHLRVAYHVTGEGKFLAAYRHLAITLGYAKNVERFATQAPAEINYSDEELAYLTFYPLLRLEDDPALKLKYLAALEGLWRRTRDEKNPLWDFFYGALSGSRDYDRDGALEALERIPMDTVTWKVENSRRADLEIRGARGRFGEKQAGRAIPPDQRAVMKWNGNPFELDGGDGGRHEDDGTFFLLPYWLARAFHL